MKMAVNDARIVSQIRFSNAAKIVIGLILLGGLIARLILILRPIDDLVALALYDDAFYYFKVAQNILATQGVSFDGVNFTNGFHPLWMIASLSIFGVFQSGGDLPIYILLVLGAILDTATGLVLFWTVHDLTGKTPVALLVLSIWSFHSRLIFTAMNGMETPISSFFIALSFFLTLRSNRGNFPQSIIIGIVWGLTLLARTDAVLLIGILILWLVVRRCRISEILTMSIVASVLILPWVIWNVLSFGTVVQVSGLALPLVAHTEFALQHQGGSSLFAMMRQMATMLFYTVTRLYVLLPIRASWIDGLWLVAVAGLAINLGVRFRQKIQRHLTDRAALAALVSGVWIAAFVCVHVLVRWSWRPYYAYSIAPAVETLVGLVAAFLLNYSQSHNTRLTLLILSGLFPILAVISNIDFIHRPQLDQQREMVKAAYWLRDNTAPDVTVGSFNAGILGYRSDRRVINLDGTINNAAFHAIEKAAMASYLNDSKIQYLADFVPNESGDLFSAYYWETKPDYQIVYQSDMSGYNKYFIRDHYYLIVKLSDRAKQANALEYTEIGMCHEYPPR